jgi:hypothetical protein
VGGVGGARLSHLFGKPHNDNNGWLPAVGRWDGLSVCNRCGTTISWLKTARHRIPFEQTEWSWRDHRNPCTTRERRIQKGEVEQYRVTPVRSLTNRLAAALVRDGRRFRPGKARKARSSRDESVAHVPATQAGEQMTRRAVAQATAPPSTSSAVLP